MRIAFGASEPGRHSRAGDPNILVRLQLRCQTIIQVYVGAELVARMFAVPILHTQGSNRGVARGGGWSGDTSAGMGMFNALRAANCNPKGKRVPLSGAGGAGSAFALSVMEAGAA